MWASLGVHSSPTRSCKKTPVPEGTPLDLRLLFAIINVKNFHGSLTTVVRAQNDTTKTAFSGPGVLVLHFQVLHFPPVTFGPPFYGPAFSVDPL